MRTAAALGVVFAALALGQGQRLPGPVTIVGSNASLAAESDTALNGGSATVRLGTWEAVQFTARTSSGSDRRCSISGGSVTCRDGGGNITFNAASLTGQVTSAALAGTGNVCLEADPSGNIQRSAAAVDCASAGANVHLSNLTGVAVNTSLISDSDLADDLGSSALRWKTLEIQTINARTGGSGAGGTQRCFFGSTGFGCINSSGVTDTSVTANGATLKFVALAGGGLKCLHADNNGNISLSADDCDGKANVSLNNLSGVAINTTLESDSDLADDLGTTTHRWKTLEIQTVNARTGGSGSAGTARCFLSSTGFGCVTSGGVTDTSVTANGSTLKFVALAVASSRCLHADVNGNITVAAIDCVSQAATGSVDGYLTSTDWNTFNGKANASLNNLSGVAINTTLESDTDLADDLGTTTHRFKTLEIQTVNARTGGAGSAGTARCFLSSSGFGCVTSGGVTDTSITANGTTLKFVALAVATSRCLHADVNGNVSVTTADCGQGTVTSVTASSPLSSSGGATPNLTIQVATSGQNGYLSSTDWSTFNGKANASLNNLASVATNVTLESDTDLADDLGTTTHRYKTVEIQTVNARSGGAGAAGTARCFLASTGFGCVNSGGVTDTQILANGSSFRYVGFAVASSRCLHADASGNVSVTSNDCGSGTVTGVTASSPLSSSGGTAPNITIQQAASFQNGYLSATDWNTFNGKVGTSGSFSLGGSYTISGNLYGRSFFGNGISCSGVSDGWFAFDTSGKSLLLCAGGSRYKVDLSAY